MDRPAPDLSKLHAALTIVGELLDRHQIPYAVAGGMAVAVWGEPRATFDVDVAIAAEVADEESLFAAIRSEGAFLMEPQTLPMPPEMKIVRAHLLDKTGVAPEIILVDFLLLPSDFATSLQKRRVQMTLSGRPRWVCSCEDLIVLKLLSGRPKDIEDVRGMLRIQQAAVDREYVRQWARRLDCEELWRGIAAA